MTAFAYTVRTTLPRGEAFAAWVSWLRELHVADVCAAGAEVGEVVVLDGDEAAVECRYRFASRDAFAAYERDHAPRLRAEGLAELARHGLAPGAGVTFVRSTGEVVHFGQRVGNPSRNSSTP